MEEKTLKSWMEEHKKEIKIASMASVATVLVCVLANKKISLNNPYLHLSFDFRTKPTDNKPRKSGYVSFSTKELKLKDVGKKLEKALRKELPPSIGRNMDISHITVDYSMPV